MLISSYSLTIQPPFFICFVFSFTWIVNTIVDINSNINLDIAALASVTLYAFFYAQIHIDFKHIQIIYASCIKWQKDWTQKNKIK